MLALTSVLDGKKFPSILEQKEVSAYIGNSTNFYMSCLSEKGTLAKFKRANVSA